MNDERTVTLRMAHGMVNQPAPPVSATSAYPSRLKSPTIGWTFGVPAQRPETAVRELHLP